MRVPPLSEQLPQTYRHLTRRPWPQDFPDVLIHADELLVKQHACYRDAKAGDAAAALELVEVLLNIDMIRQMATWSHWQPVLISVHAEEALGKNAIPEVMADVLAFELGWGLESEVVQANIVNHTGADGFTRLARQALFEGVIEPGSISWWWMTSLVRVVRSPTCVDTSSDRVVA